MNEEELITQNEAAELKNVSIQTVNNWVRRGRVRTEKKFGKVLVYRSDVLAYERDKGGRPRKDDKEQKAA